ncbi:MAG: transglutaminase family protein [Propionibacteriaceae bacterium]|nr:transglutaminase family protein [Propionibacteriaceae bacterium]
MVMAPRRYLVEHLTRYRYDAAVEAVYNRGFIRPRDTESQLVLESELVVSPQPDQITEHLDYFGNHSTYLETRVPHTEFEVVCRSRVEVDWPEPDLNGFNQDTVAGAARELAADTDPLLLADFTMPSPLIAIGEAVRGYASEVLDPHRPLGDALVALCTRIHGDFEYRTGATSVMTTLNELLSLRSGVCQDFAHLAVGCLRAAGLPARYVSGYLETEPPPGAEKLQGADATHAWVSVLTPTLGWVDLDPTNAQFADSRYIVTAWGRDFTDVSPLRGVVFTEATASDLTVEVDVTPLD